ncbi:MAG: hypothetical protein NTY77_00910 [Elusimicrobia bacterium]|nr:hypothetical protein [Elusimicrobiota bacterium]
MRYWVRVDREIRGPYTFEELAAQGTHDSTLVCPENRPNNKRQNWLPLRKAKEPPRFYVRVGSRVRGPMPGAELGRVGGFCGDTLVCPERRNYRNRWNWAPAKTFAGLRSAPASPVAVAPREAAPVARRFWDALKTRWRQPPVLPLLIGAAAVIVVVLLWMKFSYLPRVRQTYLRVHASIDLAALAVLQERYHRQTGSYADDLATLVAAGGDPGLPADLAPDLDLQTLFIRGTSTYFMLEANALDEKRTLIRHVGWTPVLKEGDRDRAMTISSSTAPVREGKDQYRAPAVSSHTAAGHHEGDEGRAPAISSRTAADRTP